MNPYLEKLINLGIDSEIPSRTRRKLRLTNGLIVSFMLMAACYGFLFYSLGLFWLGHMLVLYTLVMIGLLWASYHSKFTLTRTGFIAATSLIILGFSILIGKLANIHLFYFAISALPILMFNLEEKLKIIALTLIPMSLYLLLEAILYTTYIDSQVPLSTQTFIYWCVVPALFVILLINSQFLFTANEKSEMELEKEIFLKNEAMRLLRDQQQKLVHSSKMSALGEMASGMAHEINNPLTIIQANLYNLDLYLKKDRLTREIADEIIVSSRKTCSRIKKIVEGMQIFSRDASQDPHEVADIAQIINQTRLFVESKFKENQVDFSTDIENPESKIQCNPVQISQALLNLLTNAVDAVLSDLSSDLTQWVKLTVRETENSIEIGVSDSGPGVHPNVADKIMQPFFTTKEVGKGTGLGLSIAHGIARSHGGDLFLQYGQKNTLFILSLPKHNAEKALQ